MLTQAEFLTKVERFLQQSRMTATAFGRAAVGDPNFVFQLREGRTPNLTVASRVLQFMSDRARQRAVSA